MYKATSRFGLTKLLASGIFACCGAITAPSSFAIENDSSEVYDLDQFVVVSSRTELRLNQVGSSVEVVTSSDFKKLKQPFLLESLRSIPGYLLRNNGGSGQVFAMTTRGLNTNRPTVFIDGVEVSNPGSGQILNFGTLATSGIDRVEILKGAQSSLYGADALAGVISIQTRDGREEPGGSVDLMTGHFDTYQGTASIWGSKDAFSYFAMVSYFDSEGYSVQDPSYGPEWADDDFYRNFNGLINLSYQIKDDTALKLVVYYLDSKAGYDPGDPSFIFGDPFADNYTETEQTVAKLSFDFEPSDYWESELSASMTETRDFSFSSFPFAADGDRFELNWNNNFEYSGKYQLVAGAKYEKEENVSSPGDRNEKSLYLENLVFMDEEFVFTVGGRYDDNSAYGSEYTYRGTFSYILEETEQRLIRLRGSYGTSFQAPTFLQLFSFFGDPDIRPESGTGWDLGIETSLNEGTTTFGATYFDYDIKDKIVFSFASNNFANEGRYFSCGIESYAKFQLNNDIVLNLNYTYSNSEYEDGTPAERVPETTVTAGINWLTLNEVLLISLNGAYVGNQFSLRGDTDKTPDYLIFNIAGTYELNDAWDIWLRIDNLFDEDYEEVSGFQTADFSLFGGVNIQF